MQRLDSMTAKELKKLYWRSAWITQFGWLWLFFGVIIPIGVAAIAHPIVFLIALSNLPFVWVWLYVRTKAARILFYIQGILALVAAGVTLISSQVGIIGAIILLWVGIEVLRSAQTNCLFGQNYFTHQQICQANKKRKKEEAFTDEELITFRPNSLISKICIVICYIEVFLAVGGLCLQCFGLLINSPVAGN